MSQHLYVDVHILQTVPPSNINRDDTGTPKQARFGGKVRSRVSSQAWKRATRQHFEENLPTSDQSIRTKKIAEALSHRIMEKSETDEESANRLASAILAPLKIKPSQRKADETSYLLFFGDSQLDSLASHVLGKTSELLELSDEDLANAVKDLPITDDLTTGHPIGVALFGRMVADIPRLNVDASVQVAHALSTHEVSTEFDYFTAVDDKSSEDERGAGMISTVEFNSATLYRYATVGIHQLKNNLVDHEAVVQATGMFLDSFTRSIPSGHQNSFAHHTIPHLVLVTLRTDQPVNLVSAYEKPVPLVTEGIAAESAKLLAKELTNASDSWEAKPALTIATYPGEYAAEVVEAFGDSVPFPALTEQVRTTVKQWLTDGKLS